ncbi:hypothetical protein CYLTODRAFT_159863 [Cylindrobasidium torrendii FP15055 ss-10]|uniref:MYND-type domain-containing protein n=1 Tax=Cylindrobasidium torrendii FP15055 ss-10 TaxID=1314674 RepID=A0A0D7AY59_9AGAR|nr:hypothetical protein CYLTODRAFT_159863 [Cylindrobasidium torrendii FP15055 ss-10]
MYMQVVPEVHRILNQAPFISLACRALRRIAHLDYVREGLPPTEPMGIVNDILTFICDTLYSAENVAEVLQGRAIISLLRIEAAAAKIGGGTYDQGREVNRVSVCILDGLAPFLILDLPSCHRAFERSFCYIDQHMDEGSTAPTGLRVKLEGMRKSRTALSGQLWACSNAECPQRADTSSCESRYWRCAGCGVAEYCSTACQRKDWKDGHAQQCPQIQTAQRGQYSHYCPLRDT